MKRFVVPPTWPSPPRRSWVPPKTWRPDPSWPAAPDDWQFWVDGKGNPVRGPIGRYAGPSSRAVYAGAGAMVAVLGVIVWSLSAVGLFGGDAKNTGAANSIDNSTPSPSASQPVVTPPKVPTTTPSRTPTTTPLRVKAEPTKRPTRTKTSERPTQEVKPSTPVTTTTKTVKPSRPTSPRPSTREQILRQYCIDRGWDPELCDPDNWEETP
ncbi:hypothetical protein HPO96_22295 [Kribbella sandramycini]|uniref:Uncharacterized protein n=1 Tax=Kribbella sandramycini TaxID=60450 RepID=A0A7Y4L299_9ACTN|nr:hypothetical protein [Kribbella sandramycini]MBB6566357.1 hypothetical protein [Kribbella sandramycini]NOL42982.1 hypothetical protein [Kribbella sandramycini]